MEKNLYKRDRIFHDLNFSGYHIIKRIRFILYVSVTVKTYTLYKSLLMTLKLRHKYILKNVFQNKEIDWKSTYLMSRRVTIDTNLLHFFVFFVIRKMKPLYTFFTLAIKRIPFGLNSKSYWTQRYSFHKIRQRVLSLVFHIIKKMLKL